MKKPFVKYAPGESILPGEHKFPKRPGSKRPPTPGVPQPKPQVGPIRGKVGSAVRKMEAASPAGLNSRIKRLQDKLMSRAQGPARDQLRKRIAGLKKRAGAME